MVTSDLYNINQAIHLFISICIILCYDTYNIICIYVTQIGVIPQTFNIGQTVKPINTFT